MSEEKKMKGRPADAIIAMLQDLRAHSNLDGMLLSGAEWETLIDEIERLCRSPPSPWRDMESAPKDGTRVLVLDSDGEAKIAKCVDGDWCEFFDGTQGGDVDFRHPTAWQPLPSPPLEGGGE